MMDDLGLPSERKGEFEETLRSVSRWAVDAKEITRDTFYYQFVVAPNTLTPQGKYDLSKPFAGELKQLADLSYNTNLPDALGRYALTPIDSLPRTSLQELAVVIRDESRLVTGVELKQLLQRTAFDLIQGGSFLKGMEHLTLRDLQRIRATDEWFAYMQDLRGLLDHPFEFGDRAQAALETSVDFMRVQDAERFWENLKGELGARTDGAAEALRASQDVYDPNINYTRDIAALDPGVAA